MTSKSTYRTSLRSGKKPIEKLRDYAIGELRFLKKYISERHFGGIIYKYIYCFRSEYYK